MFVPSSYFSCDIIMINMHYEFCYFCFLTSEWLYCKNGKGTETDIEENNDQAEGEGMYLLR